MPQARTSRRGEQRVLREKMRALGMSHRQIAVEFARRYRLRPRAAWRHAHGWSQTEAAEQISSYASEAGLGPGGTTVAMTSPHLCEYENWPGEGPGPAGRRPTPYLLSLLAAVYGCTVHDLLDQADYEHMPPADRLVLDTSVHADEEPAKAALLRVRSQSRRGAAYGGLSSVPSCEPDHRRCQALPVCSGFPPCRIGSTVPPVLASLAAALLAGPVAQPALPRGRETDELTRIWKQRQAARYRELAVDLPNVLTIARYDERVPETGRQLSRLAVLTHLYNAASSVAKILGSFELAAIAADRAVQTADRTADPLLTGAAAYRMANVLLGAGDLGSARAVAVSAADRLRPVMTATVSHTAMWGALLATAAQAAARDHAAAEAREMLGASKVAADLLPGEQADLFSIFGPASWLIHAVSVAADLGDGAEAIRRAGQVPASQLPPFLAERRAFLLLSGARGYALRDDVTSATDALLAAEQAAPEEIHHNPVAQSLVIGLLSASPRSKPLGELAARMGANGALAGSTAAAR